MTPRILNTQPLLVVRGDIHSPDVTTLTHVPLSILVHMHATHAADAGHLLDDIPDHILSARLITCLDISQPTLVLLSPTAPAITIITCLDGCITILPTRIPSFTHIARTRPLPPYEQQRRESLLHHPLLAQCIELATLHGSVSRALIAQHLQMSTASATALLKSLTPLFYPTDATAKHFVYDIVAHRAVNRYHEEATLIHAVDDPRIQLPQVVRRYANHYGKINQLPVRINDREIVLRYIAHQLPITPMTEPQINAAILVHVAFDDYATARRDMVDLGFVMRTADGRMYQRIVDISN